VLDKLGSILNTVMDKNIRIEATPTTSRFPASCREVPEQLGAVDGARDGRGALPEIARGGPRAPGRDRLRRVHPVASNDTPKAGLNRRIEIVPSPD